MWARRWVVRSPLRVYPVGSKEAVVRYFESVGNRTFTIHDCLASPRNAKTPAGRYREPSLVVIGPSGRKGAFESPSPIRKRNQTNQLQTKLLTSGPGGSEVQILFPRPIFSEPTPSEYPATIRIDKGERRVTCLSRRRSRARVLLASSGYANHPSRRRVISLQRGATQR